MEDLMQPTSHKVENANFETIQSRVVAICSNWGLYKPENANPQKQTFKLLEEAGELVAAEASGNVDEQKDAIGDCMVVLVNYCVQKGYDINECFGNACEVISKRTGKIVNGTFIKDK